MLLVIPAVKKVIQFSVWSVTWLHCDCVGLLKVAKVHHWHTIATWLVIIYLPYAPIFFKNIYSSMMMQIKTMKDCMGEPLVGCSSYVEKVSKWSTRLLISSLYSSGLSSSLKAFKLCIIREYWEQETLGSSITSIIKNVVGWAGLTSSFNA